MGHVALEPRQATPAVRELFARSLVWDNHTCTTIRPGCGDSLAQLERHRRAGIDIVGLNVSFDGAPAEDAIILLADFRRWLLMNSEDFTIVERLADIEQARQHNKLAVFFNIEGGNALRGHASMVSLYYALGVRWMLFAYNRNNALAGGCQDEDTGLTAFGLEVLSEMERVGMTICCSHIGERSAMEVLELARQPVIFSHSNPRGMWQHARNISDEVMRACAQTGGVICINGIGVFLGDNDARPELIANHIEYTANLIGTEHVGIGLDYVFDQMELQSFIRAHPELYPPEKYPSGMAMAEPESLPQIAEHLLKRGLSEEDVGKILGGNLLRVASQVWK